MTDAPIPRIMVVEDSATQAAALAELLQGAGYETLIARRAEDALEMLATERVQLVLSDVVMPGMDGYTLCSRIRAVPEWNEIPVVLLTSLNDPLAIVRGLESGAEHYVTKPYASDALLARVRGVIDRSRSYGVRSLPFTVELLGTPFTISASKEQILELLVSSYSDLVQTSEAVRDAERRARFLSETTELLSSSLDVEQVLADLAELLVPRVAEICAVDFISPEGARSRVALTHAYRDVPLSTEGEGERSLPLSTVAMHALERRTREVVSAATRAELSTVSTDPRLLAHLAHGETAMIIVPLVARERVLAMLTCVAPANGDLTSPVTIELLEDVAGRAALALENASLYAEARRATRARDDVLAIVSHDLRNPINTIQLSASMLLELQQEPGVVPPYEQHLKIIGRATRRANALIQDLLDVSRIDSRTLGVELAPMSASTLLADAALELEPLVTGNAIRFECAWTGPDATISADRSRMLQAFSNLVGNALKFTPKGGLISLAGHASGGIARFEVSDSGAGIAPEHIPHLFNRFWKGAQSSRVGAGLGLFIVRGIIESHGGRVEVDSAPGIGTTFTLMLPVRENS